MLQRLAGSGCPPRLRRGLGQGGHLLRRYRRQISHGSDDRFLGQHTPSDGSCYLRWFLKLLKPLVEPPQSIIKNSNLVVENVDPGTQRMDIENGLQGQPEGGKGSDGKPWIHAADPLDAPGMGICQARVAIP